MGWDALRSGSARPNVLITNVYDDANKGGCAITIMTARFAREVVTGGTSTFSQSPNWRPTPVCEQAPHTDDRLQHQRGPVLARNVTKVVAYALRRVDLLMPRDARSARKAAGIGCPARGSSGSRLRVRLAGQIHGRTRDPTRG